MVATLKVENVHSIISKWEKWEKWICVSCFKREYVLFQREYVLVALKVGKDKSVKDGERQLVEGCHD